MTVPNSDPNRISSEQGGKRGWNLRDENIFDYESRDLPQQLAREGSCQTLTLLNLRQELVTCENPARPVGRAPRRLVKSQVHLLALG